MKRYRKNKNKEQPFSNCFFVSFTIKHDEKFNPDNNVIIKESQETHEFRKCQNNEGISDKRDDEPLWINNERSSVLIEESTRVISVGVKTFYLIIKAKKLPSGRLASISHRKSRDFHGSHGIAVCEIARGTVWTWAFIYFRYLILSRDLGNNYQEQENKSSAIDEDGRRIMQTEPK